MLGVPVPDECDGNSLAPILADPSIPLDRPVLTTNNRGNHGVRNERYRYIRYKDGGEELYDHADDPLEWRNLAPDPAFKSVIEKLSSALPTEYAADAPRVSWPADRNRFLEAA